ncbi:MAG: NAD(P)/FAD-dependent oxidoreductase [Candidatus Wallbacteria bacterium]|nr:NAD(P)/FAD-dependent oxidoreductase [Candidatus Wallbacteria bacterium]
MIVVGGGAAGMMAAIRAAELGRRVLLLEKNPLLGRKVLVSGNGRCNIANAGAHVENFHGENNRFLHSIFARFGVGRTLEFFEELGLALKEEKLGRIFPVSNQAASVVALLAYRMEQLGVRVACGACVTGVEREGAGFRVDLKDAPAARARRVVLAPGGRSFPKLGTTGDGYEWARGLGHRVTELHPALAPMEAELARLHGLQGIRLEAELTSKSGGKRHRTFRGDLLFTAYGLSGPTVLAASADLATRLAGTHPAFEVSFFPGQDAEAVEALLARRWEADPGRRPGFSFVGLLPGRMGHALLESLGIDPDGPPVGQLGPPVRRRIAQAFTRWEFRVSGCRGWEEAEVTAGGVAVDGLDPRTLESRHCKGLYFCGEVLDIFGDWGGYNFQFAWSTGWIAGEEAAK